MTYPTMSMAVDTDHLNQLLVTYYKKRDKVMDDCLNEINTIIYETPGLFTHEKAGISHKRAKKILEQLDIWAEC